MGAGGGTVTQGPAGSAAAPWYVAPGTGVTWTLGGALPAFAATPTFNIGTAPTLAVNWSGQSVAVSNFPATQAVSIASLPALAAGANVIGGVTQSGGPWTVSWSGQSVAATQSGTWNIGSVASLPALAAGSNTIGAVTQAGGPWTINHTQIAGATLGAATAWGAAPSGNVQGVNANVLALPALPAGSNTVGNVGVNNNPVGSAAFAASQASIGTAAAQIVAARAGVAGTGRIAVDALQRGLGHGLFRRQRRHDDDWNAASRRRFGDHQHAGRDLRNRRQRNPNHRRHGDLLMRKKFLLTKILLALALSLAATGARADSETGAANITIGSTGGFCGTAGLLYGANSLVQSLPATVTTGSNYSQPRARQ